MWPGFHFFKAIKAWVVLGGTIIVIEQSRAIQAIIAIRANIGVFQKKMPPETDMAIYKSIV
ncbi:MAG: hypothetical protein DYH13_07805 [Alphaproteobacteria bacterium PRO2]|nr:hypothetical protein [Alphaproteobacteria bacterium PRO2]